MDKTLSPTIVRTKNITSNIVAPTFKTTWPNKLTTLKPYPQHMCYSEMRAIDVKLKVVISTTNASRSNYRG